MLTAHFTYVAIFVLSLGAAAYVTDGSDVLLLKATLVIEDGDAVFLQHKGQSWLHIPSQRIAVVISILNILWGNKGQSIHH